MADPVIVEPKPESESTVIQRNRKFVLWSAIVAGAPTLIEVIFRLLSNDAVVGWLVNYVPYQARVAVLAIIGIALQAIRDRRKTVAPIAGTPAAAAQTLLDTSIPENREAAAWARAPESLRRI